MLRNRMATTAGRGSPSNGTASGATGGRSANRRKNGDVARVSFLDERTRLNRTNRRWRYCRRGKNIGNASCQLREHQAHGTVVIGRMGRAAGNIGSVVMVLVRRSSRTRAGGVARMRGGVNARQIARKRPRQWAERWP